MGRKQDQPPDPAPSQGARGNASTGGGFQISRRQAVNGCHTRFLHPQMPSADGTERPGIAEHLAKVMEGVAPKFNRRVVFQDEFDIEPWLLHRTEHWIDCAAQFGAGLDRAPLVQFKRTARRPAPPETPCVRIDVASRKENV